MTRRRRARRWAARALATALAAALLSGSNASAQEQPIVFGQKKETNWLSLTPTYADLELRYRALRTDVEPVNAPSTKFSEDRLEETFTLSGFGSVYHPNLVFLDLSGTFGLYQADTDNEGVSDKQCGTLYEWDATATFLRKEDFVPSLYSRSTQQFINRTFGATYESTITTTGAVLDIRKQAIPTRIEVFHSDQNQTTPGGDVDQQVGDFELSQDSLIWHSEHRPSESQVFTWDYTYNKIDQSTGDVTSKFDTQDATLAHSIDFGAKEQHNLSSSLHYFNQSGDFASEQFIWDELLLLRHTDTFETHYEYTYDQQSFESANNQNINRGVAGFTHRLYKSLITNGDLGFEEIQREAGDNSSKVYGDLRFDYQKQVPLGRFTGGAAVGYIYQENDAQNTEVNIVNQPGTFTDGQPIVIVGNDIPPSSIVVTDSSGLIVYINGLDYTVTSFPSNVQINRVIGGRIVAGQTVLIDYTLPPQPANTTTTGFYSLSGRYDFDHGPLRGLGVYARYANQNQDIQAAQPGDFTPNSFTDVVIGGDYRFWRLQVGVEQEWYDSTIVPYDATRFWIRYVGPLTSHATFTVNANYDILDYPDDNNHIELWTVTAQLYYRFTPRIYAVGTVLWRDEQNDLNGTTRGIEEQIEFQWRRRQTTAYMLFRNSNLTSDYQDNSFQFFEVGVRRQF